MNSITLRPNVALILLVIDSIVWLMMGTHPSLITQRHCLHKFAKLICHLNFIRRLVANTIWPISLGIYFDREKGGTLNIASSGSLVFSEQLNFESIKECLNEHQRQRTESANLLREFCHNGYPQKLLC